MSDKKDKVATGPYVGIVTIAFKAGKKTYAKGSKFSTMHEPSFKHLINSQKIKKA